MGSITCAGCGKRYDYTKDEFCPKCGSYNPPPARQSTRRPQTGPAAPRMVPPRTAAPGRTTPKTPPKTPNLRKTPPTGFSARPSDRAADIPGWERKPPRPAPRMAAVLFVVGVMAVLALAPLLLLELVEGKGISEPAPEPDFPTVHAQYEEFTMNGWTVSVESVWEPELPESSAIPEGRCIAVDLWIEGGERLKEKTFVTPRLTLDDGPWTEAVDGDVLLSRQLRSAGVYDVVPSDAQWEDPLFGQLVFFLPDDAAGPCVLTLHSAAGAGETAVVHTIPLELPELGEETS